MSRLTGSARAATLAGVASLLVASGAGAHVPPLHWKTLPVHYPGGEIEEGQGGAAGGKLYVFGGFLTTGARHGPRSGPLVPLADAYAFDPAPGSFRRLAPLTSAPVDLPF